MLSCVYLLHFPSSSTAFEYCWTASKRQLAEVQGWCSGTWSKMPDKRDLVSVLTERVHERNQIGKKVQGNRFHHFYTQHGVLCSLWWVLCFRAELLYSLCKLRNNNGDWNNPRRNTGACLNDARLPCHACKCDFCLGSKALSPVERGQLCVSN